MEPGFLVAGANVALAIFVAGVPTIPNNGPHPRQRPPAPHALKRLLENQAALGTREVLILQVENFAHGFDDLIAIRLPGVAAQRRNRTMRDLVHNRFGHGVDLRFDLLQLFGR